MGIVVVGAVWAMLSLFRVGDAEVGATPAGAHRQRLEQSHNFQEGVFINQQLTDHIEKGRLWSVVRRYLTSSDDRIPHGSLSVVAPDFSDFRQTQGVQVVWLGHATVLLAIDSTTLLIDPVFAASCKTQVGSTDRFAPAPVKVNDLPVIDVVIISHDHYDHLEFETVKQLSRQQTTFVVPLGVAAHLSAWGVPGDRVVELDWWESVELGPLEIICSPARHYSGRSLLHMDETLWASWVIAGRTSRVYYGGDTGYSGHFRVIGDRFGPFDLSIMPIGAYDEAWPDIHLTPEEAWRAHREVGAELMLPVHWGTFDLAFHHWSEPIHRLVSVADDDRVLKPKVGQIIVLDSLSAFQNWWMEEAVQ